MPEKLETLSPLLVTALAALTIVAITPTAEAATPIIYDEHPFMADGSKVDLHEGANLTVTEVVPGAGVKLSLAWNGNTENVNVAQGSTYTFEVEGRPYVKVSEIETRDAGDENYTYIRIQQHLGYDVVLGDCTVNQTREKLRARFSLSNDGFRFVDAELRLIAGGESKKKTYSLGGGSSFNGVVEMDWNYTEEGPVSNYTLFVKAPDEKNTDNNYCEGVPPTPTPLPTDEPGETPTPTATPTPTDTPAATEPPSETPGEPTPTPTETEAPLHPFLAVLATVAAAVLTRR